MRAGPGGPAAGNDRKPGKTAEGNDSEPGSRSAIALPVRVTALELFFDVVFAFTLTQLAMRTWLSGTARC
jgi:hypothetical protein